MLSPYLHPLLDSTSPSDFIPPIFCWTKMGSEAGQSLDSILRRKELERRAGGGVFSWGIGNSLGATAKLAQQEIQRDGVDVLFTPMRSPAKHIDVAPSQVLLWSDYIDENGGQTSLPLHMVITSRGNLEQTGTKRSHYALICDSHHDLTTSADNGVINSNMARNFASLNPLGASQVTAVVRYLSGHCELPEKTYPITFRAKLHGIGFVRLASPVVLDRELTKLYRQLCESTTADEWAEGAAHLRLVAEKSKARQIAQKTLFDDVFAHKMKSNGRKVMSDTPIHVTA